MRAAAAEPYRVVLDTSISEAGPEQFTALVVTLPSRASMVNLSEIRLYKQVVSAETH